MREARLTLEKEVEPAQWDTAWTARLDDVRDPVNECEEYALKLRKWYMATGAMLSRRHIYETFVARSLFLTFQIGNSGQTPAENVALELCFSASLSVDKDESDGMPRSAPDVPESLRSEIEASFPKNHSERLPLYPGWDPPRMRSASLPVELLGQKHANEDRQNFTARIQRLEHGTSRLTKPLRVSFRYDPARDVVVAYTLHASNQPSNSVGEIRVEVIEMASPPLR